MLVDFDTAIKATENGHKVSRAGNIYTSLNQTCGMVIKSHYDKKGNWAGCWPVQVNILEQDKSNLLMYNSYAPAKIYRCSA